jgi:isoamylase
LLRVDGSRKDRYQHGPMNAPEPRRTAHPGEHYPLGARWDGGGVNFAVFAEAAERVEVEVYLHPAARAPVLRLDLAHRTGPIFS